MSSQKFQGKVAVITGSSRGIGKAIALELAKKGASIVLNGRNQSRLNETENDIRRIYNNVISVCCDVATIGGGQMLIDAAFERFGRIDFLVSNVGISMRGIVADLNPEVFKIIFDSNVLGTIYPTIPAIKYLRATKGSIVFISSLTGIRGLPFLSAYSSSKMALRGLAESLRIEEIRNHLHIGLIYVGFTENDPDKEAVASDGSKIILEPRFGKGVYSKESVAKAVVRNILKRKFITILTPMGKLIAFMQPLFPWLVERLILINLNKFTQRSK